MSELAGGVNREGPTQFDEALNGVTGEIVHHIEVQAVSCIDVVDGHDVGMSQATEGSSFLDELTLSLDGRQLGSQDLDGDGTVERHVPSEVHGSHPAEPELVLQFV